MTLYTHIDSNVKKTWILLVIFFIVIIGIGFFLSYYYGNFIILVIAVGFSFLMSFFSYWNSDKIVLSMSKAKPLKDNPELYRIVENLCITAGLPTPKIYIIEDPAPNAFATGRNADHAVIAVTTGLLKLLDRSELEGVIAHELAHVGNKDMLLQTMVVVLVGSIVLLSHFFIRFGFRGKRSNNKGGGQAQTIIMIVGLIFIILSPVFAKLIQLAISRKREYLADASGALLTRYPQGLAGALKKISLNHAPIKTANKATAHLYIASPFKKSLSTHPPMEERIKRLTQMNI